MKKLIPALFLLSFAFASCKKNSTQCYHCVFATVLGVTPPPQDYCGDDGGTRQFTDSQGHVMLSSCTPK